MSKTITATHERVDAIPAIIAHLKKMRVAEVLDTHFPTNGNWQGLRLGWTTVVWLAFILSEGDHRLYRVEPWVKEHPRTLRRCIGITRSARATSPMIGWRPSLIISAWLNAGARVNARSLRPCCASTTCEDASSASTPQRQRPT